MIGSTFTTRDSASSRIWRNIFAGGEVSVFGEQLHWELVWIEAFDWSSLPVSAKELSAMHRTLGASERPWYTWSQWEYADQVGETLMLSVFDNIECCKQLPAIPWFHRSSHAVPKHYVTLHLLSTLSHFIWLPAFVHLSTLFHFWNSWNLCLPHGDCIVGVCLHSWNSCPESVSSTRSLHCGLWGSFIIMVEGEAVFWICQKTS